MLLSMQVAAHSILLIGLVIVVSLKIHFVLTRAKVLLGMFRANAGAVNDSIGAFVMFYNNFQPFAKSV